VLLAAVVAGVATFAYSATRDDVFSAQSRVLLTSSDVSESLLNLSQPYRDPAQQSATEMELARLPAVSAATSRTLGRRFTAQQVQDAVSAVSEGGSRIIRLTARDGTPDGAATVANAFAQEYVVFKRQADAQRFETAERIVRSRIATLKASGATKPQISALEEQAQQISLLGNLQTGNAQVIQRASVPSQPIAPRPVRSTVIALVFGALAGTLLAIAAARLDPRVRDLDAATDVLGEIPVLGVVPEVKDSRDATAAIEAFRNLHTNLQYIASVSGRSSIVITSVAPGEGKSTVAMNLAAVMAEREQLIALVDADMRRPGISTVLGASDKPGLSQWLADRGSDAKPLLSSAIDATMHPDPTSSEERLPRVFSETEIPLVPAGHVPPNPQALISRADWASTVADWEGGEHPGSIIIDGPPIGSFSDVLPIATSVTSVLLVIRIRRTSRIQLQRVITQLRQANIEIGGAVVVAARTDAPSGYYDYYGAAR
jgi:succinoglycan biosynthesis transport protein ExoP